jgi:hypothetical protein
MGIPIRVPLDIMTMAERLAREVVGNKIREQGIRMSTVNARDITSAAKQLATTDFSFIAEAQRTLATKPTLSFTINVIR